MNVVKYLMSQRDVNDHDTQNNRTMPLAKRIECADGFSISVQANWGAYCNPRENIAEWTLVECGFPSSEPELIMNHAEDPEKPTETVYGYVPTFLVEELIAIHGGQKEASA